MKRLPAESSAHNGNRVSAGRNNSLLGLWRYTETFNSGSGDNFASLSTDYFMEFKNDGTVYSWSGKSAGSMGDINIEGHTSTAEKANWYTEGKTLFLENPATGSKTSILYYAEPGRMMLHNGGQEKKILTRIR
ncbi:MAG: hypothetical protein EOO13_05050 [Chitinophagaceae bacterium]|nr:MAG: hypothetical protein EOO13_05050 [Chitinophagaceae bacterium]